MFCVDSTIFRHLHEHPCVYIYMIHHYIAIEYTIVLRRWVVG